MLATKIMVNLPAHQYPIYIGEKLLSDSTILTSIIHGQQIIIVTNETVAPLYLQTLKATLSHYSCHTIIIPDGERYKTISQWEKILNALADAHCHRDATLLTLGGGVVGDMGGFAAACYQRGINYIQIPTTLLAQVDASIGGKTAINHAKGKNLIGAFHQPQAVIIDINTLQTLPPRELHAGLAEIIKAALIQDPVFFTWLETNIQQLLAGDAIALLHAIQRACEIKKAIVVADEKEQNIRAVLNLGHTFAHAIEHELAYGTWLHGEAVAVGLVLAAQLSCKICRFPVADYHRIVQLLQHCNLPTALPPDINKQNLLHAMHMDKKIQDDRLRFILLKNIGDAFITSDVTSADLRILL